MLRLLFIMFVVRLFFHVNTRKLWEEIFRVQTYIRDHELYNGVALESSCGLTTVRGFNLLCRLMFMHNNKRNIFICILLNF